MMKTDQVSLEGKVALITGASRGIGHAIAFFFADAGADLAICSRKIADIEKVADEIRVKGRKCIAMASHVAKKDELVELVKKAKSELGRIDILVNNAGTNPFFGPLIDAEEWAWDTTMNVNLKAAFLLSQLVAREMREQGGGSIINMASTAGLRPGAASIYSVTKAGLVMLTKTMAREWGQYNIRVNAICPGVIMTRFSEALWKGPTKGDKAAREMALGRLGLPEDVAGTALFLASELSSYITGETILIDGGELIGPPPVFNAPD